MGVGRSGTTAIYSLLQEILENNYPADIDYVYEPFLWDRATFNKPYSEAPSKFRYVPSVSVEGMYHHRQIPLLLNEQSNIPPASRQWLKDVLTADYGKKHYLGKMIRANGRVSLIREVSPQTKIIFLIRNPVDVINSASQSFSFYGPEFHTSDFPRFKENVVSCFQEDVNAKFEGSLKVEMEYAYWLYSNRSFLSFAERHPENVLTIAYEAFVEQRDKSVEKICEFLELDYQEGYSQFSKTVVGPVKQNSSVLTFRESEFLFDTLKDYRKFIDQTALRPSKKIEDLVKLQKQNADIGLQGATNVEFYNGMYASTELRSAKADIESQLAKIRQLQLSMEKLQNSKRVRFVNWILSPLDKIRFRAQQ